MIRPNTATLSEMLISFILGAVTAYDAADSYSHALLWRSVVMATLCAACSLWFALALFAAHEEWKHPPKF